jgi:hypothetical protein
MAGVKSYEPGPGVAVLPFVRPRLEVPKDHVGVRFSFTPLGVYAPGPGVLFVAVSACRPLTEYCDPSVPIRLDRSYVPGPGVVTRPGNVRRPVPKPYLGDPVPKPTPNPNFGDAAFSLGVYSPGPGEAWIRRSSRELVPKTTLLGLFI